MLDTNYRFITFLVTFIVIVSILVCCFCSYVHLGADFKRIEIQNTNQKTEQNINYAVQIL